MRATSWRIHSCGGTAATRCLMLHPSLLSSRMKNPAMMQQAQQMMSNPVMAQQAAQQMKNMSGDDLKKQMDMAQSQLPQMGTQTSAAVPPVSVVFPEHACGGCVVGVHFEFRGGREARAVGLACCEHFEL